MKIFQQLVFLRFLFETSNLAFDDLLVVFLLRGPVFVTRDVGVDDGELLFVLFETSFGGRHDAF